MDAPTTPDPLTFPELRAYRMGLDPHGIAAELQHLVATRRRGLWLICRYLADLADGDGLRVLRYDSVHDFAWNQLGMTRDQTNRRVRVGRALRELPAIERAFVLGDIGFARVREIVKVATAESEAHWLRLAQDLSRPELERKVARARYARPEQPEVVEAEYEGDEPLVQLQVPLRVWERLEAAIEAARVAEGAPLGEDEALEVIADSAIARLDAQARQTSQPRPMGRARNPAETAPEGPADPAPAPSCAAQSSPAPEDTATHPWAATDPGPIWEASPPPPDGLSEAARRIWAQLDSRPVWNGDELADATGLGGAETAAALGELTLHDQIEKVSGGWRRVRRQAG
jgi:hypothetical protein